jgi:hypothetical protein
MNQIAEYKIISGRNCNELEKHVNDMIARGFQPLGGVCTLLDAEVLSAYQAMVKYAEDSN